jgi:hypothetical protein
MISKNECGVVQQKGIFSSSTSPDINIGSSSSAFYGRDVDRVRKRDPGKRDLQRP